MDGLFTEAFRTFAGQGTGWLLFACASGVAFFFFRLLQNSQSECAKSREIAALAKDVLYEKWLSMSQQSLHEVVTAINQANASTSSITGALADWTTTRTVLAQAMQQLHRDIEQNNEGWKEAMKALADDVKAIRYRETGGG